MKRLILKLMFLFSVLFITSCNTHSTHHSQSYYKLKDTTGYCTYDNNTGLWMLWYLNATNNQYYYGGTQSSVNYDNTQSYYINTGGEGIISESSVTPSTSTSFDNSSVTEATGESVGGSNASNSATSEASSESTGESAGGSDSGGDSGGGDGGGGGE